MQNSCKNVLCKQCFVLSFRRYGECPFCPCTTTDDNLLAIPPRSCSVHEKICMRCDQKMSLEEFENHQKCVKDLASDYAKTVGINESLKAELFLKTGQLQAQKTLVEIKESAYNALNEKYSKTYSQAKMILSRKNFHKGNAAKLEKENLELKNKLEKSNAQSAAHQKELYEKQEKIIALEQQLAAAEEKNRQLSSRPVHPPCSPDSFSCYNRRRCDYVVGNLQRANKEIDRKEGHILYCHRLLSDHGIRY